MNGVRHRVGHAALTLVWLLLVATGHALAQGSGASASREERGVEPAADSPRASMSAYLDASGSGRWQEAARYLSLSESLAPRGPELAERLKAVLDRYLRLDLDEMSPASGGRTDDGLAPGVDEVGVIRIADQAPFPLRFIRIDEGGTVRWVFARPVVQQIDGWYGTIEARWIVDALARYHLGPLLRTGPFNLMWWQWIALLVAAAVAASLSRALGRTTRALLGRISARTETTWDDKLLERVGSPISVAWALFLFNWIGSSIGLSAAGERVIAEFVRAAALATIFWAAWRSVTVFIEFLLARPWAADSPSARHLLTIGANLSKGVIAALGILALLSAFGYQVTTVLAGLGIGGLALAFGAQKTVENLFGSVALAVDQPFRVGDFVKVEDFTGVVEDIGLRSTRFRTLDRTRITIPNGKLADQRLESFAVRDRMRLATTIGLEYRTSRAQMRQVLDGFEQVLRQHPQIWSEAMVVRFKEFGASSLDIEIMAWFAVPDWATFQQCRQDVLLEFMRVVEEAGTAFAFPTRTIHVINDPPTDAPPLERLT